MTRVVPAKGEMKAVTDARRAVIVKVLKGHPGATLIRLMRSLEAFHAQGKWPPAPWKYARQEPYRGGVYQMLQSLIHHDVVVGVYEGGTDVHYYLATQIPAKAETMLPAAAEREVLLPIAEEFVRRTGMEIAFGVTGNLTRVVRVQTPRGIIDTPLKTDADWVRALRHTVEELGYEELAA